MARRKGKRFTPKLLAKFDKEGRGRGTQQNYAPYHQVTRSDPSSKGTSTIVPGQKGFSDPHLLSEGELVKGYFFAAMLEHLDDLRSQYKLNLNHHAGEAIEYLQPAPEDYFPGTLQLATAMGIVSGSSNGSRHLPPCAGRSWLSEYRPAGPSRTMRPLCDSAWSICSTKSTSEDSAPLGSSRTAVSSMSGWPLVFPAQVRATTSAARLVLSMRSATCGSASVSSWRKLARSEAFSGIIISVMISSRSMM